MKFLIDLLYALQSVWRGEMLTHPTLDDRKEALCNPESYLTHNVTSIAILGVLTVLIEKCFGFLSYIAGGDPLLPLISLLTIVILCIGSLIPSLISISILRVEHSGKKLRLYPIKYLLISSVALSLSRTIAFIMFEIVPLWFAGFMPKGYVVKHSINILELITSSISSLINSFWVTFPVLIAWLISFQIAKSTSRILAGSRNSTIAMGLISFFIGLIIPAFYFVFSEYLYGEKKVISEVARNLFVLSSILGTLILMFIGKIIKGRCPNCCHPYNGEYYKDRICKICELCG